VNARCRKLAVTVSLAVVLFGALIAVALATQALSPQVQPSFASSNSHRLVIKADGSLWAWGANANGALGDGGTAPQLIPIRIGTATDWASVTAGDGYSLAIKSDGSLWAWGANQGGQLGVGDTQNRTTPFPVDSTGDWTSVSACKLQTTGTVNASGSHSLAVKADGSLWAWGSNAYGQLGTGDVDSRSAPTRIGSESTWVAASAGTGFSIALKSDGSLWAWGRNNFGQLGDGTSIQRTVPVRISNGNDWVRISAGLWNSVALKSDGSLWAWGMDYGELSVETGTAWSTPTRIGTRTDWMAAEAGPDDSFVALTSDGSLWTWGIYAWQPVGSKPGLYMSVQYAAPTRVGQETGWTAIAAGTERAGLKADGTLWTWSALRSEVVSAPAPKQVMTGVRPPGAYLPAGVTTTSTSTTSTTSTTVPAPAFSDVPVAHPYHAAIEAMASRTLISGYPDGTFGPDKLVLRKHFAKMIVGVMGLPVTEADWQDADPPFTDCGPDDAASLYPHDYIAVAKAHGLTAGKTATTFAPDATITRAQMVTMVVRAAQNSGIDLVPVAGDYSGIFKTFTDATHGANVHLADANGLLIGLVVSGDPGVWMAGSATRGEVAQVLWNLMQKVGK
jgi:hypothetical protein